MRQWPRPWHQLRRRAHRVFERALFPATIVRCPQTPVLRQHFAVLTQAYAPHSNPFAYYRRLIELIERVPDLHLHPLRELLAADPRGGRLLGLRHDIDGDPIAAVRCARYLAQRGVPSSFFLLHTAPYYGGFFGRLFVRQPELRNRVRELIAAGVEIGIHNDCLGVYTRERLSGAQHLVQELDWLRGQGAVVRGTVAHRSGPAYGAENYEIFAGRQLWQRLVMGSGARPLPLGLLSEENLGLAYEGTFATALPELDRRAAAAFFQDRVAADVRSMTWMRRYLLNNPACRFLVDYQFWLVGRDTWVVAGGPVESPQFDFGVGLERMVELLASTPAGSRCLMVLHPEYIS